MNEIAPIIGSLAQYNVIILIQAGVLLPLFESLSSNDLRVVESCARAIRAIVQHPIALSNNSFQWSHINSLIELAKPPVDSSQKSTSSINVSEICISILARLAEKPTERIIISDANALPILVEWLNSSWSTSPRVQEAALDALSSMCKGNDQFGPLIANFNVHSSKPVAVVLFRMLQDKRASMRLGASTCLSHLYNSGSLTSEYSSMVSHQLLPAIIRLFDDTSVISSQLGMHISTIQERAIDLFAFLIYDNTKLQSVAMEGDAITRLAKILEFTLQQDSTIETPLQISTIENHVVDPTTEKTRESVLLALASVTSMTEECRKQVIDLKLLPHIVQFLESKSKKLRIAACQCAKSLSRSVKHLRTSLMDVGIALPLYNLLFDPDLEVQTVASATLCNIVLDFSPMKKIIIERQGVKQLVALIKSPHSELRLNAAWALKNMLYQTDLDTKKGVMTHLSFSYLNILLEDPDLAIQTQALSLLRNLACAKIQDIEYVFEGMGSANLMNIIENKLTNPSSSSQILLQSVYIAVNIAIGSIHHKNALMERQNILRILYNMTDHDIDEIRIASLWCFINLTWPDDIGSEDRVKVFKSMNLESRLNDLMKSDINVDVRERSRTALSNMKGLTVEESVVGDMYGI
ncbi:armadillo-type protein [Globomyces pollinis-pini]|nr:armadillo-type protein [Globomyces pollinis-pini]